MIPLNYVLSVILIVSPPGEDEVKDDAIEVLVPTIGSLASGWQLMDEKEINFYPCVDILVHNVKYRYFKYQNYPPVQDSMIFPDRELLQELMRFNREYVEHLNAIQETESNAGLEATIVECNRIYHILDLACDAKCDCFAVWVRRDALKMLQVEIGYENYYGGVLPPHVPVWRFKRTD